ncbi:hypothetical protein KJY73_03310 [Bowmanella sp. Y26]|uniref:hypothetical protein n=1 Tax=Bowmanella yangjiangensis TaxID=2811230 RepID=UPI001BDD2AF3|nr:hypothetical protein [Bowmanella yangjiangensis]MBT1062584.1 hypothetical protein [Bowmanella yangjiangensis]
MDKPRIRVDFNELIEPNLVLLSKTDEVEDSAGHIILLQVGKPVAVYEYNHYESGEKEYLLAEGVAVLNEIQQSSVAKWCCRINSHGMSRTVSS